MSKRTIRNTSYEGERPLFASRRLGLENVTILPGESALKECSGVEAVQCEFNGKYPFWHNDGFLIENCLFREGARAAIWYSRNLHMKDMEGMVLENVVLTDAQECCWHCRNADLRHVEADRGDYFFMHGADIRIDGFRLNGNYSFQYCRNVVIRHAEIHSKDAFWNTENVIVYDSVLDGEYLGWHSKNLRLVNCRISGTQPLCYAENLVLENCTFAEDADLCFEYSSVQATVKDHVPSIKNPRTGFIRYGSVGEIIIDENIKGPGDCRLEKA